MAGGPGMRRDRAADGVKAAGVSVLKEQFQDFHRQIQPPEEPQVIAFGSHRRQVESPESRVSGSRAFSRLSTLDP